MSSVNFPVKALGQKLLESEVLGLRRDLLDLGGDFQTSTGSGGAYVLDLDAQISTLKTGAKVDFLANHDNPAGSTPTLQLNSSVSAKNILFADGSALKPSDIKAGMLIKTIYDGTQFLVGSIGKTGVVFGGDGSDGALTVTSGTTNIDLGGASIFIKNYSSISITGSGAITFSNPATGGTKIIFKSKGDVTLTSSATPMLDLRGAGAAGGGGGAAQGVGAVGNNMSTDFRLDDSSAHYGTGGVANGAGTGGTGGGAMANKFLYTINETRAARRSILISPGAGGGGGAGGVGVTGGDGGRGGGAMIMECAGAWNFTTTAGINCSGQNGSNGNDASSNQTVKGSGGGGGGAAGMFIAFANVITANTGTVICTGGTGGTGGSATSSGGGSSSPTGGGGGGGAGHFGAGGAGGGVDNVGVAGTSPGGAGGGGGGGVTTGALVAGKAGGAGQTSTNGVFVAVNNYF